MPHHVVVDGSNIATEGRTQPSLQQLNDAVLAYLAEHPKALVTVVVDATFGHRIDPKEVAEFDAAVANNELVTPPAGAIGRGDAFVLSIANKAKATILSNDSFQEFHGQYAWLFEPGRLVGGKPVPHVGWVFVERLPVRGPTSRRAVSEAQRKSAKAADKQVDKPAQKTSTKAAAKTAAKATAAATQPMPVPKAPPPAASAPRTTNELLPFLTFVERHPAGTSVNAIVDHYSSHGAYVRLGDVVGYVPLRLMANPAPRSAREHMKVGESVTLVVDSYHPSKRSVDLAVPGVGNTPMLPPVAPAKKAAKKAVAPAKKAVAPAKKAAAPTKKAAAPAKKAAVKKAPAPVKKGPAKKTAAAAKKAAPAKKAGG